MSYFLGKKAVAPVDFCEFTRWGLETTLEIVGNPQNVHVIHVAAAITDLAPAATWDMWEEKSVKANVVNQFRQDFPDPTFRGLPFEVRFGDPGQQITRYAKEIGAELIVLPSHGRTGLSHLLIGSVAERVARLAHCPVLILRR
jgi:nucleotide-binding universal stress UspA family protein